MLAVAALCVGLLGFVPTSSGDEDWKIPPCEQTRCNGKRIKDSMGLFEFCVPPSYKVHKMFGFEGDFRYTISVRRSGRKYDLIIVGGSEGRIAEGCRVRSWTSPEAHGEDCVVQLDGLKSRKITLNSPSGYALYGLAPPDIATQFDQILDSLCWQPWDKVMGSPSKPHE